MSLWCQKNNFDQRNMEKQKILIWGYGREGKSILEFLKNKGVNVNNITVATREPVLETSSEIRFIAENDILEQKFDLLIKSPGISFYRPEIKQLQRSGVSITSALNILLQQLPQSVTVLGITGTKGKSTTASCCQWVLKNLGFDSRLVGNIGIPFLEALVQVPRDYLILELSSSQLKDMEGQLDYGVVLNLFPEHLDWHQTHNNYFRDKLNLLYHSRKCFLNSKDPVTAHYVNLSLYPHLFNNDKGYHVKEGWLYRESTLLKNIKTFGALQGEHMFTNLCALLTIFQQENLSEQQVLASIETFSPLQHRLQIFHENFQLGIKFVDDSISTIPEATIAALKTFQQDKIFLLLGGFDRQQDYTSLVNFMTTQKNLQKIFLLGQTGKRLSPLLPNSNYFDSLQELVKTLRTYDLSHITVLLSPAAPSFDMFRNFEERGDIFQQLMQS
jgi:UDP-N-acetylmuramoylalanine--D-glutamate ligase